MITVEQYMRHREAVQLLGWADEITWAQTVAAPTKPSDMAREAIYVICNSGMKWRIARAIYDRVMLALLEGRPASSAFGHEGKAAAIQHIWDNRVLLFAEMQDAMEHDDMVEWCAGLPWIGGITKYHLAKNLGADVAKPDRHLVRIAAEHGETVDGMCQRLADASGDRIGTVDLVLWRLAAEGVL